MYNSYMRRLFRLIARFGSFIMLLLILPVASGCDIGPIPIEPRPSPTPASSPTATVPEGARGGTLRIRLIADASSLNPWLTANDPNAQQVQGLIFSGLTRLDNRLQPQPDLAQGWDVSADGTTLTFRLRRDVVWQDGQPFTSADVVWSYKMLARLPAANTAIAHIQDAVTSVQAVDPSTYTVQLSLKRRDSPLLADLAIPILPSHILSGTTPDKLAASPFNGRPVGTGPFAYDSRQPNQSITLKANGKYYAGPPLLGQVQFLIAPDPKVAQNAVRDGTLQLAELPPDLAESLVNEKQGIRGGFYDEPGYDFVAFNLRPPHPFSDTRLRQAWALALDKPGLVFQATGSQGDPVWSAVNKASWAYNPNLARPGGDPQAARKLLADAGWTDTNGDGIVEKDGKPLQVSLYVRSDDVVRMKAAQAMVDPLRRAGIDVKVQPADFNTALLARISPNANPPFDFDVIMLGWTRTSSDPDSYALFHSSQIPTSAQPALLNFSGFAAPEYDSLSIQARSTYDFAQRRQLYTRIQSILADQLPYYYLWAQKYAVVAGPKLRADIDFSSPRYMWNITQWWVEK